MARQFGTLDCSFWQDPYARKLSHDAILLYVYVRSSPHSSASSAFVLPLLYIEHELRMPQERALAAFKELSRKPFVMRDAATDVVFIPDLMGSAGNRLPNSNLAKALAKALMALPDCTLKATAIAQARELEQFRDHMEAVFGQWKFDPRQAKLLFDEPPAPAVKPSSSAPPEPQERAPKAKAMRLPQDWSLPPEWLSYATQQGFSDEETQVQAQRFHRYFTGPDAKKPAKKDWYRTWVNWLENHTPRARKNGNGVSHGTMGNSPVNGTTIYKSGPDDARWPERIDAWNQKKVWLAAWGPKPGEPGCKVPSELLLPS